jgi:hypothetical protein
MYQQLLDRTPSAEDYRWLHRLSSVLPHDLRDSPAFLSDVVLRTEHIRCLKDAVASAAVSSDTAVQAALERRINEVILIVAKRLQDKMPSDPVNSLRRLWHTAFAWTLFVVVLTGVSTWTFLVIIPEGKAVRQGLQLRTEAATALGQCLDEAHNLAKSRRGSSPKGRQLADHEERNAVSVCAAEFIDVAAPVP